MPCTVDRLSPLPRLLPFRDENEDVVGQLLLQGYLSLDFGITAYATNTYLKACSSKLAQLLQGGKSVVVTRSGGGGQQVGRAGGGCVIHTCMCSQCVLAAASYSLP